MKADSDIIRTVALYQFRNGIGCRKNDPVVDEDVLKIVINGTEAFSLVFSMVHTRELAAGILFSQGIVSCPEDMLSIEFDRKLKTCSLILSEPALDRLAAFRSKKQTRGSSGGTFLLPLSQTLPDPADRNLTGPAVTPAQVRRLIDLHGEASGLFHQTGAVHNAGLCRGDGILAYFEDIGRHNAVDKLAGHVLLNRIHTSDKIVTLSCRMSLEIIGKIANIQAPVVISNAAPTLSAINLARAAGITMIGFARNDRFNVYTGERRIQPDRPE